jgi:hypothetical protein
MEGFRGRGGFWGREVYSTEGIRLRSSSKNEAVQIERAASSPTMSTVKSIATLAIIFRLLDRNKPRGGMLAENYRRISAARN